MRIVRSEMSFSAAWLLTAFLLGLTAPAHAGDGVIEINQAKAEAGGVTPGDTEGFPVTISESGSYRLTGNLTVPDENTTAIEITADDVTIDLNGFAILGPTDCSSGSCTPTGPGVGIESTETGISVINGTVRGMGSRGIDIEVLDLTFQRNRISNVIAADNGGTGIRAHGAIISACVAKQNGGSGIETFNGVVTDSLAQSNGNHGIRGINSMVSNNTSLSNKSSGIVNAK